MLRLKEIRPTTLQKTPFSFTIKKGEIWCILGPNGIGKSTLLHCMAGIRRPLAGHIFYQNIPVFKHTHRARWVGLLPQRAGEIFPLRVRDVLRISLHHSNPIFIEEKITQTVEQLELTSLANRLTTSLSGGEYQRVAIACVFAQDPPIYLLDEPSTYLDFSCQRLLAKALLKKAAEGKSIVMATHDMTLAKQISTHYLALDSQNICLGESSKELSALDFFC